MTNEYIRMLQRDEKGDPIMKGGELVYKLQKVAQKKYTVDDLNDRGVMKFANALIKHMLTEIPLIKKDILYHENKNIKLYQKRIIFAQNSKIIDGFCDAAGYDEKKIRQGIIDFCNNEIKNLLKRRQQIARRLTY